MDILSIVGLFLALVAILAGAVLKGAGLHALVSAAAFMIVFVGRFGEVHSNAGWITHQWMTLSFMPTVGISIAITALVGKAMGAVVIASASATFSAA